MYLQIILIIIKRFKHLFTTKKNVIVNEALSKFSSLLYAKHIPFFAKNFKEVQKFLRISKKSMSILDFMHTGKLYKSLNNDFVKLIIL